MINFKLKKAVWTTIYMADPSSYIKNFSVAQLNWERNKQELKATEPARVLVGK